MLTDDGFVTIGPCKINPTAQICQGAIIGKPFRPLLDSIVETGAESPTVIGEHAYIGYHSVIGSGSRLSEGVIVDDHCSIESDVDVGAKSLVIYRAQICNEVRVGANCIIGGFVAERVVLGDRVRVFGKIIHSQHDPCRGWDDPEATEPSAILKDDTFVGFDALVVGGVILETSVYVCAGAVVTRNVPTGHIAYGVNKIIPYHDWKGPLAESRFFMRPNDG